MIGTFALMILYIILDFAYLHILNFEEKRKKNKGLLKKPRLSINLSPLCFISQGQKYGGKLYSHNQSANDTVPDTLSSTRPIHRMSGEGGLWHRRG